MAVICKESTVALQSDPQGECIEREDQLEKDARG